MRNRSSVDFAVFLMIHRREVVAEHAMKRSCVVVHCQKPANLIEPLHYQKGSIYTVLFIPILCRNVKLLLVFLVYFLGVLCVNLMGS